MKVLIICAIVVFTTVFITSVYFLPKKKRHTSERFQVMINRYFGRWESFNRLLSRTRISVEKFILLHLLAALLSGYQLVNGLLNVPNEELWVWVVGPLYLILAPLYLFMVIRSNSFSKDALSDVEEIQRITHFLERTGASSKNINQYLAQTIKGPLGPYMKKIAASSLLSIDVKHEYQCLKGEFKDMREVVNYANISIQKQMTGKSDALYQQQLDQIKNVKLAKYKLKRSRNRIKLTLFALLMLLSFLSVTLYPMSHAFMNDLIQSMSN